MSIRAIAFIFFLFLFSFAFSQNGGKQDALELEQRVDKYFTIFQEEDSLKELGLRYDKARMYDAVLEACDASHRLLVPTDQSHWLAGAEQMARRLIRLRPHLIDAGMYYNSELGNYKESTNAFEAYWNYEDMDYFFNKVAMPLVREDSVDAVIKYYAGISAIQSYDIPRAIRLLNRLIGEPYVPNHKYKESDPYELLAVQYADVGNQEMYMQILKIGCNKFPENQYFAPNLINEYIKAGDMKSAINYLNKLINKKNNRKLDYMALKANIYMAEKDYKKVEKMYKAILKEDKKHINTLEGLGLMYALMAQDKREAMSSIASTNRKKIVKQEKECIKLYEKSYSSFEELLTLLSTSATVDYKEVRLCLGRLQNVYYNLSLLDEKYEQELERVDNLLKNFDDWY